jgi:hypothetical protein
VSLHGQCFLTWAVQPNNSSIMIAKLSVFCFFVEMNGSLFCGSTSEALESGLKYHLFFLGLTFIFGPADLNRRIVHAGSLILSSGFYKMNNGVTL